MKNYVFLLIDSLNYSHVKKSKVELMPFLSTLKKRGFSCENMYSQAPYTEAALMGVVCGQDILDYGGYMFRYKDTPLTLFEAMQNKGFETFTNSYEPQCHPSSVARGIDVCINGVGYDVGALWTYRIKHYSQLYHSGKISEDDYIILDEIIRDNLVSWIKWTNDLLHETYETDMIRNNAPQYDPASVNRQVQEQYESYIDNPREYLNQLLQEGSSHPLFSIKGFAQHGKLKDREIVSFVKEEFRPLFKRIRHMDLKLNAKNGGNVLGGPLKKCIDFIKQPSENHLKDIAKAGLLSINSLIDLDLFDRIDKDCDHFKDFPSLRSQIDYFMGWATNRQNEKPYFAMLHVCDVHNPEIFFTYDSDDKQLLHSEMLDAHNLLDQIPSDYRGSLTHDLSLRYIDGVIKYFYEQLENNQMANNTVVIICADHGFSFSGNPLRDSAVVNLYLENYNIPFVVTGAGHEGLRIDKLCESKDIPATICDLVDGCVPKEFSGHSVLSNHKYDYLTIEYCGGGCPDLKRRDLKMASFDNEYFVGTLGNLKDCSESIISEIYDLKNDPLQFNNLVRKTYDIPKVQTLFKTVIERKEQLQQQTH